jgi:hypothetical protein
VARSGQQLDGEIPRDMVEAFYDLMEDSMPERLTFDT